MQSTITYDTTGGDHSATDAYRHSTGPCLDLWGLDQTTDRYQLLLLVKRVGKEAGFTPRMIQLLDYYMAFTTQVDWEEGSRPIVFQSLARTAMDLGVGERQIQKLEKRLFELGAITWNDSGNHKRYGRRSPQTGRLLFAYGVDLTPLAYLKEELEAKLQEKQLYAEAWRTTKREISQQRRQIRELLVRWREEGGEPERIETCEQQYRKIAIELRSHLDLDRLRDLAKAHSKLCRQLQEAMQLGSKDQLSPLTASPAIAPTTRKRSCRHAQKFAHLQHTTPPEKNSGVTPYLEYRRSSEKQRQAIGNRLPEQIAREATGSFRAHLPASIKPLAFDDIIEAAYRRRLELGISKQAWADACRQLGRIGAASCLILTDHATSRTAKPVGRPSAYFQGVVRKSHGLGR
ncbi:plasmid replication protein RepC [Botrimarina hoheduenensis]|uniref:Plasmid replication protein C N-terminal domain-containing protein n=1 Tax=Botrimarina hoheduenensis TaxID=2528000 RepID=A0A5C5VSX8_9BACT|nr:plasmid replication protein RepC [Botrimarina hoheduenensis]TWT41380.1 hypothetical protein Pla111_30940 [Botrimarina hoheduenensis]